MLEDVATKLGYAAAEFDWDEGAQCRVLVEFISEEVRLDRVVLERFHAFLDDRDDDGNVIADEDEDKENDDDWENDRDE